MAVALNLGHNIAMMVMEALVCHVYIDRDYSTLERNK